MTSRKSTESLSWVDLSPKYIFLIDLCGQCMIGKGRVVIATYVVVEMRSNLGWLGLVALSVVRSARVPARIEIEFAFL